MSPSENPIDGLGVILTVRGSNFDSSAEVWLDRGRPNQRRLDTVRVDSSTLAARAPRSVWIGSSFGDAIVSVLQGGVASPQTVVFNYYFPCGTGSETGPYGNFTGNSNGSVVLDASLDELRFRADTRQLVIDGVRLSNTVFVPSNANVTIDGDPVARIYSALGANGQPVAVIGTLDGHYLRDQTRGAVDSASERSCSAWVLSTTPFPVPMAAALGAGLEDEPASMGATTPPPCPAVEIGTDESGRLSILYSNLVPGRLYLSCFGFADADATSHAGPEAFVDFSRMQPTERTGGVGCPFLADATWRRVTIEPPMATAIAVTVVDASNGAAGCGSFARSGEPSRGDASVTSMPGAEATVASDVVDDG